MKKGSVFGIEYYEIRRKYEAYLAKLCNREGKKIGEKK